MREVKTPSIWNTIAPLTKDQAVSAMDLACRLDAYSLRLCAPHIPHSISIMVLELALQTAYPYVAGDTVQIFLFLNLSPYQQDQRPHFWRGDGAPYLGEEPLTSFVKMSMLMGEK